MKTSIKSGIYIWINKITNQVLVGQTTNFAQRKSKYLYALRKNIYGNRYFQAAWNKYGEDAFEFRIIEEVKNFSFLTSYEQQYLNYYKSLNSNVYNLTGPTDNPNIGKPCSLETRQKISKANKGKPYKPLSIESRKKLSVSLLGNKNSKGYKR